MNQRTRDAASLRRKKSPQRGNALPRALAYSLLVLSSVAIGFAFGRTDRADVPAAKPAKASPPIKAKPPRGAPKGFGVAPTPPPQGGRFRSARTSGSQQVELTDAQLEAMRAIGYESGSVDAPKESGVTKYDTGLAYPGLNLETDGHAPAARLMDMQGRTLHRWSLAYDQAFPDNELPEIFRQSVAFWRRAHLLENGDLLAIFEGIELIKIDRDSKLLWSFPKAHHDLEVREDGTIYVLTRKWVKFPQPHKKKGSLVDYITVLDTDGNELRSISIYEAIKRSPYSALLENSLAGIEMFHTNTIEVLDGSLASRIPAFKEGNVLISLLNQHAIAVVDMAEEKIVWAQYGMWLKQHQPTVVDGANLMVFDNLGNRGRARVIEFDPETQEVLWLYDGGDKGLFSETCGSNQRLPNGNTLITESDSGRAVEITRDKQLVWEYYTPNRAGENDQLIATLFEIVRLPPDFPVDWAENGS